MSTPTELLRRHRPFLKYDSNENYFADWAGVNDATATAC